MPDGSGIKWLKPNRDKLSKAISKFNAKITRETKKNPRLAEVFPSKLNVEEEKAKIKSTQELNKFINSINRAFRPGAFSVTVNKYGVAITEWEKKETTYKIREINKAKKKELEKYNPSHEKGTKGTIKDMNLLPKKNRFDKVTSQKEWDMFKKSIEKQVDKNYMDKKHEIYADNYRTALKNEFGVWADDILKMIENVPPDIIIQEYYSNPFLEIGYVYDQHQSLTDRISRVKNEWKRILKKLKQ